MEKQKWKKRKRKAVKLLFVLLMNDVCSTFRMKNDFTSKYVTYKFTP